MIKAEAVNAAPLGQGGLAAQGVWVGQIVVPDIRVRHAGLIMAGKTREGGADVGPFRESFSPPFVVFRNGVELGQVKGQGLDIGGKSGEVAIRLGRRRVKLVAEKTEPPLFDRRLASTLIPFRFRLIETGLGGAKKRQKKYRYGEQSLLTRILHTSWSARIRRRQAARLQCFF